MPEENKKFSFISSFVKTIVLLAVSALAVGGNFMLEKSDADSEIAKLQGFSAFDYVQDNLVPDNGILRFADKATYATAPSMDVQSVDVNTHEYIFKFNAGKVWGNFLNSDAKVNILIGGKAVIIPNNAVFDLESDGKNVKITTFEGDVYLGFLDKGITSAKYADKFSEIFMNRLVVPRDSQVTVYMDKIDQRLKGLLYSRLVTEFKSSAIPEESKKSEWVISNEKKDLDYLNQLKDTIIEDERFDGNAVSEGKLSDFILWTEETLTFMPEKKRVMFFEHMFAYLNEAVFYANKEDVTKTQEYLMKFGEYKALIPQEIGTSEEYYKKLDSYIDQLAIFNLNEPQYVVYKYLLDKKFESGKDNVAVLDKLWLGVYKSMDLGDATVKTAVENYYSYLNKMTGKDSAVKNSTPDFYKMFVAYQDQLFENLFLKYSSFYQDAYFAIKTILEGELLSMYDQGQLRTELSQDLISTKIDFLRRLMNLFFEKNMKIEIAKDITSRLIQEINDLMPPQSAKVAVIELFQTQLNDLGDFWGYLNSVEYNSSKAYGETHKDRYQIYLKDRDRVWSFANVTDAILGGGSSTFSESSLDEVKNEVKKAFEGNKDVTSLEIGKVTDPTQRYVDVRFIIGGYPVIATFDRIENVLTEISAYEQVVSVGGVKLDDLLKLMNEKLADQFKLSSETETGGTDLSSNIQNNAQRIAKLYLANKIKTVGFEITEAQIALVDETNLIYRIDQVFLKNTPNTLVTFDFSATTEKASNLYFLLKDKPIVLQGEYTLVEVHDLIVNNQVEVKGQVKKVPRGAVK